MRNDDAVRRIDALLQVGLRLARSAPSGQILLARIADAIDLEWIPRPWGEELAVELAAAQASAGEPVSAKRIEQALREARGARPADELDDFDRDPVAVTATCQVHRGVLDGARPPLTLLRARRRRVRPGRGRFSGGYLRATPRRRSPSSISCSATSPVPVRRGLTETRYVLRVTGSSTSLRRSWS